MLREQEKVFTLPFHQSDQLPQFLCGPMLIPASIPNPSELS